MEILRIDKSNHNISLQDMGRPEAQHLGVSVSGAAEEYAFLTANTLLGNDAKCLALEVIFGQVAMTALNTCTLVLTGANCDATIDNQPIACWQPFELKAGQALRLNQPKTGVYTYLATLGGFTHKQWLSSGVVRPDQKWHPITELCSQNDEQQHLFIETINSKDATINAFERFYNNEKLVVRFIGNQYWQAMSPSTQESVLEQVYTVDSNSNKMGYRVNAKQALPDTFKEVTRLSATLSMPVTYGTIQVPSDKQFIILMKDRQTIGGYPTIGTVMKTDLFRLCQLKNGQQFTLALTSLTKAQQQLAAFYQKFGC